VAAIAAGNALLLKPGEFSANIAHTIVDLVTEYMDPSAVLAVFGGVETTTAILEHHWDLLFFTGSTTTGRIIYEKAAAKLIPCVLELGGKSPCIVESDANIKVAARRIAMTSFSNCGQMCVAPDYVLVHSSKKEALVMALQKRTR
jgi:aldehyde dehydrogenase (NAD+)